MSEVESYDVVVIGGGPGGLKAALEAAESRRSVLLIESEPKVGGACVQRGTIPSKALRETAISLEGFKRRTGSVFEVSAREDLKVASLMTRLDEVVRGHEQFLRNLLGEACIVHRHGRGRFVDPHTVEVLHVDGGRDQVRGEIIVVATGSRPNIPDSIAVDHAHVLTSDSIQCLTYLPETLAVLGGGVIACEYASTFSSLGVEVTLVDRKARPLGFVDPELSACFQRNFVDAGNHFHGDARIQRVSWDGVCHTVVELEGGQRIETEKCLVALGRVANTERLRLDRAGITPRDNGTIQVDEFGRSDQPHVYAVGDVVGHPGLAAAAIEQGRRAVRHALGLDLGCPPRHTPYAVYTIPEISCVGLDEESARRELGDEVLVGRVRFDELARGQIAALRESMLKLVSDRCGRLLGVQIFGEGAAELITVGQMALRAGMSIDDLLETVFNFPTLAEAYRVAALDISRQRESSCVAPSEDRRIDSLSC